MRKIVSVFFIVLFSGVILIQLNCNNTGEKKTLSKEELIKKGKLLVDIGDCNVCHSPKIMTNMGPVPDSTRLLSGFQANDMVSGIDSEMYSSGKWAFANSSFTAWVGSWGISYTANLTPDPETGLGSWTEDLFIKAIRTGKHMGVGRPILPPMPWRAVRLRSDDDLKAIFAYLHSLPAISNRVPDPVPPDKISEYFKK
jgi:hypothetical protein